MDIIYSVSLDTANGEVDETLLSEEIIASGIDVPATGLLNLTRVERLDDVLTITHVPALSVSDSGVLDDVVAAHSGFPLSEVEAPGPSGDVIQQAIDEHAGDPSAHHIRYSDSEASGVAVVVATTGIEESINNHISVTDAHHTRYTDAEASGVAVQVATTGINEAITNHSAIVDAHHTRYTDSEASGVAVQVATTGIDEAITNHTNVADAHHSRYTDAEASGISVQVTISGIAQHTAINDAHHARYSDAEASGVAVQVATTGIEEAIANHASVSNAHHARYTDAEASGIAVQVATTGIQEAVDNHAAVSDAHHSRYTDAEAEAAATGVVTLQTAYNADPSEPQIELTTNPITIRDNGTPLSSVLNVQDSAGTVDLLSIQGNVGGVQAEIGSHDSIISGSNQTIMRVGDQQNGIQIWPTSRTFTSSPGSLLTGGVGATYIHDYPNVSFGGLNLQFTFEHAQAGFVFNHFLLFNNGITFKNENGTAVNFGPGQTFISQPTVQGDGASVSMALYRDFLSQPTFNTINGGGLTVTQWGQVQCFGQINTGVTVGQRNAIHIAALLGAGGTLTTERGIYLQNLDRGSTIYGIHSEMTGTSKNFIHHPGTSPSNFGGEIFMSNSVPITLGTTGGNRVSLLRSAAGTMRMIGTGGTHNEGLDWNFDGSANNVLVNSSTGAGLQINTTVSIGTSSADPSANWQLGITPGAKTITVGGDFSRCLFSASANVTVDAAMSNLSTWTINSPGATIGTGSVVNGANIIIQTAPNVGTNRYGLLITSNPTGGTLNYAFRQSNASARARFDGRLDINRGVALGGGATATLGTIGGSGPTTAAQAQWVEIDVNGVPHWIAAWT